MDLAHDTNKVRVAYCVSTINSQRVAEVDSIYVREEYRSLGIGDQLMKRSLEWMDEKGAKRKKILVTAGNQDALSFYQRYGFKPRRVILEQIPNNNSDDDI